MDSEDTPAGGAEEGLERLRHECICVLCPTYTPCAAAAHELLYCFVGRSPGCIAEDRDCICPTCPVAEQVGLEFVLFCLHGSEQALRAGDGSAEGVADRAPGAPPGSGYF